MKIVDDDGDLIDDVPDGSAVIIVYPDKSLGALLPKIAGDVEVPANIQLGAALLVFLRDKDNVREVMRHLPRKRNRDYRAN